MQTSRQALRRNGLLRRAALCGMCFLLAVATTLALAAYACNPMNPLYRKSGKGFAYDVNGDGYADVNGVRNFGLHEWWIETQLSTAPKEKAFGKNIDEVWTLIRPLVFAGQVKNRSFDEFVTLALRSSDASYTSADRKPPFLDVERREAGWPLLAFRYQSFHIGDDTIESSHIVFHFRNSTGHRAPGIIPVIPIWRGVTVNVLAFSALWYFMLTLIPVTMRIKKYVQDKSRTRHIAAGRCPNCRYIGGHIGKCPECGNIAP